MRGILPAGAGGYDPFAVSGDPNQLISPVDPTPAPSDGMQPIGDVQEWHRQLLLSNSGVFYEDANLQVGMTAEGKC